jgi:hypothetical protein
MRPGTRRIDHTAGTQNWLQKYCAAPHIRADAKRRTEMLSIRGATWPFDAQRLLVG